MKKKLLKISFVGKTNAGKSTLINNIIGETISITNKKINTTEDLILGVININENQIIIYDTPGINFTKDIKKQNLKLKKNLWEGLDQSDIIFYIVDSTKYNLNEIKTNILKLSELNKKISIIFNKNDLIKKTSLLPMIAELSKILKIEYFFSISAKKKLGFDNLKNFLIKNSYHSDWEYNNDEISNKDDIFITNECTRNAVLSLIHKEIPYNIIIINKLFKYLKNGDLKIKQEIQISNPRYKKIILGKKGNKIKEIRIKSQDDISKILKSKTHLYLTVIESNAKKI